MARALAPSPWYNQALCARAWCDVTSDIPTCLYVTDSRPHLWALLHPCMAHLAARTSAAAEVQPRLRPLCPHSGKKLFRQSCQTQFSLSNRAGRQGSLFFFSDTRSPNQGHPVELVPFPEGLTENLVLMADCHVSVWCVSSF